MHSTFLTLLLFSTALLSATSSIAGEFESEFSRLQVFALDPFDPPIGNSMVLGNAIPKLVKRFGEPEATTTTIYPDRTSDRMVGHTTMRYPGLIFDLFEDEHRERSTIKKTEILSANHRLKFGVTIGSTVDDILTAFEGENHLKTGRNLRMSAHISETRTDTTFRPNEEVTGEAYIEITFELSETDRVTRIVLESIEF
jgi:hypothetical protein